MGDTPSGTGLPPVTMEQLVRTWDRFWFRPASPLGPLAIRTLVALNALWIVASRPDLPALLGWPSEFWTAVYPSTAVRFLIFGLPLAVEYAMYALLGASLVAALFGLAPRVSCLVSAVLLYHFAPLEGIFWQRLGPYFNGLTLPILALFILGFATVPRRHAAWAGEYRWPLALIQVLFAFNYVAAWFSKLHTAGWGWISADNIAGMIRSAMTWGVITPLAAVVAESRLTCWTIAILTAVVETLFVLVPFSRWAAAILVPLAAVGHIGVTMVLGIVFLNLPLLLIYLDWDRLDERLRARWSRARSSTREAVPLAGPASDVTRRGSEATRSSAARADSVATKVARAARIFYHWKLRQSAVLPYHPTEIDLEITNRCNFKCSFCPQSDPEHFNRVPATAMTPGQAGQILQKLRSGGIKTSIIHWTLDGEPFMHKRFHEIVMVAASYGFSTHHFATNGYFLSSERLRQFPSRGQRYFLTPDFCSEETFFETHRGIKGSWRVVLDNIRACLADPELEHFHFKITDISSYKIRDPRELDGRFEALKRLFPESERVAFGRRVFHNATGYLPVAEEKLQSRPKYHLCPYPWASFTIASNGDVVACCRDLEHKTVLGNLFQQEFEAIWNGEKYQALRRDLIKKRPERQAACAGCDMPYDAAKFSLRNMTKTAVHRLLIFEERVKGPGAPPPLP